MEPPLPLPRDKDFPRPWAWRVCNDRHGLSYRAQDANGADVIVLYAHDSPIAEDIVGFVVQSVNAIEVLHA